VTTNAAPRGTTGTTLPAVLHERATAHPGRIFLRDAGGNFTYGEADVRVRRLAAGLAGLGVGPGDRVALLMGNSREHVAVWFALNRLGAVDVPFNTGFTGAVLARAFETVQAEIAIVDEDLLPSLTDELLESLTHLRHVVVRGDSAETAQGAARGLTASALHDLETHGELDVMAVNDEIDDAVMLFTSGSTGVPKACALSHRYLVRQGQIHAHYLELTADDVLYTPFPLFHIDAATLTVGAALAVGATAALGARFSASGFWDEVRAFDTTVFNYMGATASILWKQPENDRDREHLVRLAWGVPMPDCGPEWQERFGFPLVEVYGLTDAGVPAYQPLHEPRREGSCGRVIPEYQVRIADDDGREVPTGEPGEILIRSEERGLVMNGYFGMPEATCKAMRDGWFHTADRGCLDADGHLYFVARNKEVIRRRGENIAARDIEAVVDRHPAVRESAAIGVPSELSDDDIKVVVVLQPSVSMEPDELRRYCERGLPRYMVPRYFEFVTALPKTPTEKIERFRLAAELFTPTTWDADTANPLVRP
jgi:carnitine-CoA ligase